MVGVLSAELCGVDIPTQGDLYFHNGNSKRHTGTDGEECSARYGVKIGCKKRVAVMHLR